MWRSVAARASSYRQVSAKCRTNQIPKVHSYQTQALTPDFSSWRLIPKTSIYQQNPHHVPLFLFSSQFSTTNSTIEPATDDPSVTTENDNKSNDGLFDQELNLSAASLESENNHSSEIFDEGDSGLIFVEKPDSFCETGDTQMEMNGIEANNGDGEEEEEEKYEIDIEKLESVLSLLQSSVDGSLKSSLDGLDLALHEEFMVRVLETPLISGENLVEFFKWAMKKPGVSVTATVLEALVRAVCGGLRRKDAYAVWDLIKDIGEKENGVLKVGILNELISLFSRLGKGKAAFEVFNKFEEFGCVANEDTYYFTIEALCRRSIFDWAGSVTDKMLGAECLPKTEKIGKIIYLLCKGSRVRDAHSVYLLAKEKNKYPPRSSVNYLIKTLSNEDETVQLAMEMLEDFSGEVRKHAIKSFSSVIRGLCRIEDIEGAKKLLSKMTAKGPPPGNAVFNSVIDALSKAGDMEEAKEMMSTMENRGLKPDVYTYTVIMSGYAKGGQMDDACKVLSEAKKKHFKLCPVTYHILIRGYCKLEEFDKALTLLAEMKDYGVQPNTDEYNKLIQSLCLKALDWETAEKLFEEMKGKGLYLNGITQGLIRAVKELEEEGVDNKEEIAEA